MFMSVYYERAGVQRVREGAQFLEWSLQAFVSPLIWVLEIEPRSFARATNTVNHHLVHHSSP